MRTTLFVTLLAAALAPAGDGIPRALPDASVLVETEDGYGSGVVFKNHGASFVWTAAHVVEDCQKVRTVTDPRTGQPRVVVTYKDVLVTQETFEGGRKVEERRALARVIRYSPDEDIALLMVYKTNFGSASVKFARDLPHQGESVWHVGCFRGPTGAGSVSEGVVAAVGRLRRDCKRNETDSPLVFDQVSLTAHQGSSGGGVFRKSDGACLGLVVEFLAGDRTGFSYGALCITPSRRLLSFARRNGVEYAVDDKVEAQAIDDIPVEDVTVGTLPVPEAKPLPGPAAFRSKCR